MSDPKLTSISGIGPATARVLTENGFASVAAIANASAEELTRVPGFGAARATVTIQAAQALIPGTAKKKDKGKSKDKKKKKKKGKGKGKGKGKDKKKKKKKK